MDIGKHRIDAAHLLYPLVHHVHKGVPGARHILRQGHGGIGGVLQDHAVQQVVDGKLLLTFQLHIHGAAGDPGGNARAAGHHGVQILDPLQNDQGVDDLGQGTGGQLGVRVIGVNQGLGVPLVDDGALGGGQLPVGACQGHLAVQGPAAVEDGHAAEGIVRLGCLGVLSQIRLRLRQGRVLRNGHRRLVGQGRKRQAARQQRQNQQ